MTHPVPRPALTDALLARWSALVGDHTVARRHGESLLLRWGEAHRRYHDHEHLRSVLDHVDALVRAEPDQAPDADAVRLAAFFHDAVYDPTRQDNEARSAALARAALADLGFAPVRVDEVSRLVLLTATHDAGPEDGNGAVLCDADLAVLAAGPEAYAAYAVAIREEYAHVPEPLFRAGRAAVLAALLEPAELYRTRTARSWWEVAARRNVAAELVLLRVLTGEDGEPDADPPHEAG